MKELRLRAGFTQAEVAKQIDLVVEDCKAQGIETLTPEELERMALEWRQDEKGNEGDKDT